MSETMKKIFAFGLLMFAVTSMMFKMIYADIDGIGINLIWLCLGGYLVSCCSYKKPARVILWIVGSAIVVFLFEAGFTAFCMLIEGV